MATYNKYQPWVNSLCNKEVDVVTNVGSADTFKAIIHTDATALTASAVASCTQIASSNGYPGTNTLTFTGTHSGGIVSFDTNNNDIVWTASGGSLGASTTGRYFSIHDDTPTTPVLKPLMCQFDYGATFTVASTETMTLDFGTNLWQLQ